jgi:hypothetical protein
MFQLLLTETEARFQNFGSVLTEAKTSSGFSVAGFPAKFQIFCRIFAKTSANFPLSALPKLKPDSKIDNSIPVIRKKYFDFKLRLWFLFLISPLRLLFTYPN